MANLVVLISGNGSNLQAIIDAVAAGKIAGRISAVISNRADAYGLVRAQQANIPTAIISARDFADRVTYDQALQQCIDQYQPSLVVLAGFMRILGPALVQHYAGRLLNIHPSLLPKYPGLNTHQQALAAGDTEHGATVHFVTETLDGGPIIAQASTTIAHHDDVTALQTKVHQLEHQLYPQVIQWLVSGRIQLKGNIVFFDGHAVPPEGIQYTTVTA